LVRPFLAQYRSRQIDICTLFASSQVVHYVCKRFHLPLHPSSCQALLNCQPLYIAGPLCSCPSAGHGHGGVQPGSQDVGGDHGTRVRVRPPTSSLREKAYSDRNRKIIEFNLSFISLGMMISVMRGLIARVETTIGKYSMMDAYHEFGRQFDYIAGDFRLLY
jgi:hypothetical protein